MPKSKSALRQIPEFSSEADEQEFWATADSSQYIDWSKAELVRFPKLNLADRVSAEPGAHSISSVTAGGRGLVRREPEGFVPRDARGIVTWPPED